MLLLFAIPTQLLLQLFFCSCNPIVSQKPKILSTTTTATTTTTTTTAAQSVRVVTNKGCDDSELELAIGECLSNLVNVTTDENPVEETCDLLRSRINCYRDNLAGCFGVNDPRIESVVDDLLFEQLEKAGNETEKLGDRFVNECSVLRIAVDGLVFRIAGENRCGYKTVLRQRGEKLECDKRVGQKREKYLTEGSSLNGVDRPMQFLKTLCESRLEWEKCLRNFTCLSVQKRAEIRRKDEIAFKRMEENVRSRVEGVDFSFGKTC